jgi:hypothetical protein
VSNADREGPTGEWEGIKGFCRGLNRAEEKVETEKNRSDIKGKSLDHGKTGLEGEKGERGERSR